MELLGFLFVWFFYNPAAGGALFLLAAFAIFYGIHKAGGLV